MSIYIGNNFEDRLKGLEIENASLKKYNHYHQVVLEIDHLSDLHVDSSFYKQSLKIDNCHKIKEWIDSSIGQSTAIHELDKKGLHYPIQIKCKTGGGMLILKMEPISYVASTSIIRRWLSLLFQIWLT